jgi:hypothetical protein
VISLRCEVDGVAVLVFRVSALSWQWQAGISFERVDREGQMTLYFFWRSGREKAA